MKSDLRKRILEQVRLFQRAAKEPAFVPGKSYVNYAGRCYDEKELVNLVDASLDFWLTGGRYALELERGMERYLGTRHCMLANSGSSANLLAVTALTSPLLGERRMKPGDEVITTACGFPTTLNPILQNSLKPVLVDVRLGTYNATAPEVEKALGRKTRAVFLPHTLGNPFDIAGIMRVARKHGLWVIEDNCDALGAKYEGRHTGTFGHLSTLSFYAAHHMTTGEGGAVLTHDPLLAKIVTSLRDWGRDCWCGTGRDNTCGRRFSGRFGKLPPGYDHKYVFSHIGYNLKMTDMQAAVGVAQLLKLPGFIRKRRENFDRLYACLEKYRRFLVLPEYSSKASPSWFGFPVTVRDGAPFGRKDIVEYLEENRIATRMLFGGNLLKQPAYLGIKCRLAGSLANTDAVMNRMFWVGVYPGITGEKMAYLTGKFRSFLGKY